MRFVTSLAWALTQLVTLTVCSPSVIQWTSDNGAVSHMRSYHTTRDGIMESSRSSATKQWTHNLLPLEGTGRVVAAVHKRSEVASEVQIRLFYEHVEQVTDSNGQIYSITRMNAAYWNPETGWKKDTQFNAALSYQALPTSAISWVDSSGVVQWRLYFSSYAEGEYFNLKAILNFKVWYDVTKNSIYEAQLNTRTNVWSLGNGGKAITAATQAKGNLGNTAAVAWAGGRISVFYWDGTDFGNTQYPGVIREIRWRDGEGWKLQEVPSWDWKYFTSDGELTAVAWKDEKNVDQIRLYVRWKDGSKERLVEFKANDKGWVDGQSDDFPQWAVKGYQLSAVVWTYPDRSQPHIRIHTMQGDWIHEISYDNDGTGWKGGWKDSGRVWP